ncbi:MAG: TlpA family protein disulfide reductase [Anaerolineae bacterium]|jgi:cytochrome c biogenesis protein CcmG/thiol:disulfide interchange protein DsbE|nr:TlpA family protein disulfide reductase [Anaerolineae bacterium]
MDELEVLLDSHEQRKKHPAKAAPPRQGITPLAVVLLAGTALVVGLLALQLARQNEIQPQPGQPAPAFQLVDFAGQPFSLADYRGQIVVLNFWASWCAPCRDEAPDLQAIHEAYAGRGVTILGVNWLDSDSAARAFMQEFGLTYRNAPDTGEVVAKRYNIQAAPENFILDRQGVVVQTIIGPLDYDRLVVLLDDLLAADSEGTS